MSTPGGDPGGSEARPSVAGGGSIAVDTDELARAGHLLVTTAQDAAAVRRRAAACAARVDRPAVRLRLEEAVLLLERAAVEADSAAVAVRRAADRYGAAEHAAVDAQQIAWAIGASTVGGLARGALVLGPAGPALVVGAVASLAALAAAGEILRDWIATGRLQPQLDPVLLDGARLTLSSIDDAVRGFLLLERPADLVTNDPAALFGTESIAAVLAAALLTPAGGPLVVTPTGRRAVSRPGDLAELMDRIPQGGGPAGQVTVERYDGPDGPRWIVYSAGTVTFALDSGGEPFDLASNVRGVADLPTDSQRAIVLAMEEAGVGRDEPVLLVGYSQGALNAVRVAEDSGYRIGGVVEFGGPTGQIVLPSEVPRISVEHEEDVVPILGGVAAAGAGGLNRVLVKRSLTLGGGSPYAAPFASGASAHDRAAYAETMRQAEADGSPRLLAARARLDGFLRGTDGTATRYHAERVGPRSGAAPAASVDRLHHRPELPARSAGARAGLRWAPAEPVSPAPVPAGVAG